MPTWLILLLLFPFVCALIGYVTNVVAVKMIFRPHNPIRILGIGFQGVLPKHQKHFARLLSGIIVKNFMTTKELVAGLNKPSVLDELEKRFRGLSGQIAEEIKSAVPPERQAMITPQMVDMATDQMVAEFRKRAPELIERLSDHAAEKLNLRDVITEKVMGLGAKGLERIIYTVSKKELDFIEYYGGIFGFVLGVLQWLVLKLMGNLALPVVGAVVGTVTNWLAIQMLFYPREPTVYFGFFKYQGMFPKRQQEMAEMMGEIAVQELIIPREIFMELTERLLPETIDAKTIESFEAMARAESPQLFQMVDALIPEDQRPALREKLAVRLVEVIDEVRLGAIEAAASHIDIEGLLEAKLKSLAKSDFELLIRGLFEREEIYLIIYGGLLGAIMGGIQLFLVQALG